MKKILILGSGFSTYVLIEYLLKHAEQEDWYIRVGDLNEQAAKQSVAGSARGEGFYFNVNDDKQREAEISQADIVVSMLPARFHILPAKTCLKLGKSMVTASYVSNEMAKLDVEARQKGILLLNEIGLDPGIDHLSAMRIIDNLKAKGAEIEAFRSYTGGLVAPEYDNNPWHYKFTWNPRNVVLAGQGTAKFLRNGRFKYIPYHKLFSRYDKISVEGYGEFEGYPNRDSLKYTKVYGLDDVQTMLRGTLRRPGFCDSWNIFVQLGMTDDSFSIEDSKTLTYRQFVNSFLPYDDKKTVEQKLSDYLNIPLDDERFERLRWLGIFEDKVIGLENASPAQVLQKILMEKWRLEENDRDMIVMQHIFDYYLEGKKYRLKSNLVVEGRDKKHTAMAITVGTPVAIAVKLILKGQLQLKGVRIPVIKEIYEPVLSELESNGIIFNEQLVEI